MILFFPFWLLSMLFSSSSKGARYLNAQNKLVSKRIKSLSYSLELLNTTVYPKTFFKRYDDALSSAREISDIAFSHTDKAFAKSVIDDLINNREQKIRDFVDRCHAQGKLYSVKDELLLGYYDLSPSIKSYIAELITGIEDDCGDIPESGEYIYCSISFGTEGRTYHYKTTDETLKCGDEVIVPVGNNERKSVGKIEKIERFKAGETPYPPSLTKEILGRCEY